MGDPLNAASTMSQRAQSLSPSSDPAEKVRDFYERYPYPRPVDSLENYQRLWKDVQRRRADYHLYWPDKPYREDYSILVAGCGTSQAAKHALRWPKAHVTGIDISATSVRCTEELKRKYDLKNLDIHQLPIDQIDELGMSFDQIICTGVLHHLSNPDEGLRALRNALKQDGAMQLMVYAPYGRAGIYMLQEFCKRLGICATDEGIQELIAALRELPPGHPLEILLRKARDFQHEATLADALLHPQDRAYSVPQLFKFIEEAGLKFGRWVKQAPYSLHCGVIAAIPQVARMAQLALVEQYASVELFRGTMIRHSVVVYRDDGSEVGRPVSFAGNAWHSYVPIRMSDTICVQEQLPTGAAGVLINQTHTDSDLFMTLDLAEKHIFDAIDGERTVGAIANTVRHSSGEKSRMEAIQSFLKRLWWHDQVVFDISQK